MDGVYVILIHADRYRASSILRRPRWGGYRTLFSAFPEKRHFDDVVFVARMEVNLWRVTAIFAVW